MEVILNIGLNTNTGGTLEAIDAVQAVANAGFFVISTEVFQSDTEPTLVATARFDNNTPNAGYDIIANRLHQDCIAVYAPSINVGALIGPRSVEWGPFSPEFFILPSGERLAAQQARASRQRQFGAWAQQRRAA